MQSVAAQVDRSIRRGGSEGRKVLGRALHSKGDHNAWGAGVGLVGLVGVVAGGGGGGRGGGLSGGTEPVRTVQEILDDNADRDYQHRADRDEERRRQRDREQQRHAEKRETSERRAALGADRRPCRSGGCFSPPGRQQWHDSVPTAQMTRCPAARRHMPPSQSEASFKRFDDSAARHSLRPAAWLIGTLGYYLLHGPVGLIWGYAYL